MKKETFNYYESFIYINETYYKFEGLTMNIIYKNINDNNYEKIKDIVFSYTKKIDSLIIHANKEAQYKDKSKQMILNIRVKEFQYFLLKLTKWIKLQRDSNIKNELIRCHKIITSLCLLMLCFDEV